MPERTPQHPDFSDTITENPLPTIDDSAFAEIDYRVPQGVAAEPAFVEATNPFPTRVPVETDPAVIEEIIAPSPLQGVDVIEGASWMDPAPVRTPAAKPVQASLWKRLLNKLR
jgi:hypothetical protein